MITEKIYAATDKASDKSAPDKNVRLDMTYIAAFCKHLGNMGIKCRFELHNPYKTPLSSRYYFYTKGITCVRSPRLLRQGLGQNLERQQPNIFLIRFRKPLANETIALYRDKAGKFNVDRVEFTKQGSCEKIASLYTFSQETNHHTEESLLRALSAYVVHTLTKPHNTDRFFNSGHSPLVLIKPKNDSYGIFASLQEHIHALTGLHLPYREESRGFRLLPKLSDIRLPLLARFIGNRPEIKLIEGPTDSASRSTSTPYVTIVAKFKDVVSGLDPADQELRQLADHVSTIAEQSTNVLAGSDSEDGRKNPLHILQKRDLIATMHELSSVSLVIRQVGREDKMGALKTLSSRFQEALDRIERAKTDAAKQELDIVLSLRTPPRNG